MSYVFGYDAKHANIASIPQDAEVVLGYDTGTSDIRWTAADWERFATSRKVHIDQGGPGSPVLSATVRDVETGAWIPEIAVRNTAGWNPDRPTIYCNRSDLPRVLAAGWRGDLWLAIPSIAPPSAPPVVRDCTVVAVQHRFAGSYDRSVVFDPYWPRKAPVMTGTMFDAPKMLRQTATVSVAWLPVAPVDGEMPTGYTVQFLGLDGVKYFETVTSLPSVTAYGLERGWTYDVRVWANGGEVAPPHASLIVHT